MFVHRQKRKNPRDEARGSPTDQKESILRDDGFRPGDSWPYDSYRSETNAPE